MFKWILKLLFRNKDNRPTYVYDDYIHLYDMSWPQKTILPSWNNVHGYSAPDGTLYFACVDMRMCGIRVQDIIVETSDVDKYHYWLDLMKNSNRIIDTIKTRSPQTGADIDREYLFVTTDGDRKSYNMTQSSDYYLLDN